MTIHKITKWMDSANKSMLSSVIQIITCIFRDSKSGWKNLERWYSISNSAKKNCEISDVIENFGDGANTMNTKKDEIRYNYAIL